MPPVPGLNAYRSPAMRTRKSKAVRNNAKNNAKNNANNTAKNNANNNANKPVYSPERNAWNKTIVGVRNIMKQPTALQKLLGQTGELTNKQKTARINVARKMAQGLPVTNEEKIKAGIKSGSLLSKFMGKGGKATRKASRRRRMTRRR